MKDGDLKLMPSGAVMFAFNGCWYEDLDYPDFPEYETKVENGEVFMLIGNEWCYLEEAVQDWFPFYNLTDSTRTTTSSSTRRYTTR